MNTIIPHRARTFCYDGKRNIYDFRRYLNLEDMEFGSRGTWGAQVFIGGKWAQLVPGKNMAQAVANAKAWLRKHHKDASCVVSGRTQTVQQIMPRIRKVNRCAS